MITYHERASVSEELGRKKAYVAESLDNYGLALYTHADLMLSQEVSVGEKLAGAIEDTQACGLCASIDSSL